MFKLSIIIVTYNPGSVVVDCLRSIPDLEANHWEIIVVDNKSTDGMIPRIREAFPQICIIENAENKGFAGANNIGLEAAQGEYVVLMNPDVILEPDTMQTLTAYLDKTPQVGIVGPRTFTSTGKVDLSVHPRLSVSTILWQFWGLDRLFPYRMIGKYLKQAETAVDPFEVAWLQGHCLMFRRQIYEEIGGLDEGLFLYNEEPDFCERAEARGWKCVFVPQSRLVHLGSTTISRYTYVKMLHTHISMLYFFRKRRTLGSVWALKIGFVIELLMKWCIRAVQRIVRPSKEVSEKLTAYRKVIAEVIRY